MNNTLKHYFFKNTNLFYLHLCLIVCYLSTCSIIFYEKLPTVGEIGVPATLIGHFFREALSNPIIFDYSRIVFLVAGGLWSLNLLTPFTGWLTSLSYLLFTSMIFENSPGAERHSIHLVPMLFLIFSIYYQFYSQELKNSISIPNGIKLDISGPRWCIDLLVFVIGINHSWAGFSKFLESGLGWSNGISLQLWVHMWGQDNYLNDLIINSTRFAIFSQWSVIIVESSAVCAFFFRKNRVWWGLLLIFFHLVNQWMWGWNFLYWCPIILLCYSSDFAELILKNNLKIKV